jgi:hypothetical protein
MLPIEQELRPSTVSAHCPATLTRSVSVSEKPRGPAPVVLLSRPHALPGPSTPDWHSTPIALGDLF